MSARLSGHGLRNEGAPYLYAETGSLIRAGNLYGGVSGTGRALCECGALSEVLESGGKRREWHREHKAAIREATP